jgi:MFS transporter, AAHS family, 3-hydroxyphenylpropionic acid transporter
VSSAQPGKGKISQAAALAPAPELSSTLLVVLCFLVMTLEGYDIQAFGVAAPRIAAEFQLTAAQQGWAATAAMLGLVFGSFIGGGFGDRFGRKPVLLVSILAFGICSVWTALTHDLTALVVARFATGLGFGGAMPMLIAVATEISSPGRRASTMSAMFCGLPAGGAFVAMLAKFETQELGWRSLFLIGGAAPVVLTLAVARWLPETRPQKVKGADDHLIHALLGGHRGVSTLLLWAANLLTLVVLYLMLNWLPSLVVAKGYQATEGAAASLAFNLAAVVGALLVGIVVDRVGFRGVLLIVYLGLAATMAALGAVVGVASILFLSATAGFLIMGAQYSLYALTPRLYASNVRAMGAGAAVGVGRFGSIIGPLLAGQLRQAGWSGGEVLGAMLPVVLAAGAAVLALTFRIGPKVDE